MEQMSRQSRYSFPICRHLLLYAKRTGLLKQGYGDGLPSTALTNAALNWAILACFKLDFCIKKNIKMEKAKEMDFPGIFPGFLIAVEKLDSYWKWEDRFCHSEQLPLVFYIFTQDAVSRFHHTVFAWSGFHVLHVSAHPTIDWQSLALDKWSQTDKIWFD